MNYEVEKPYVVSDDDCDSDHATLEEALEEANGSRQIRNPSILLRTHQYVSRVVQHDQTGRPVITEFGLEKTAEWSRIQERLKRADELEAELKRTTAVKNQVVKNCNQWRGVAGDRTEELDRVADQLSDVWLYLDAWASSESVTIEDVKALCETLLKKQQAPGWKTNQGECSSETN